MSHNILNTITGFCGLMIWVWLTKSSPDQATNLAVGILLMLVGFGGRDTIIEIIKSWKQ